MHKELTIENFKCFSEKTCIKLGKMNVCLGSNSVGKSSVIQSCILIRQIYEQAVAFKDTKIRKYNIQLNDIYGLQLGDAEHIKSSKNKDEINLKIDGFEFSLSSLNESPMEMSTENAYELSEMALAGGLFSEHFYYLNAERIGPRNYQTINAKRLKNCGVYGEDTIHLLNILGNGKVDEDRCFKLDDSKRVNTVNKQVEYWMDYIIPGIEISTDDITDLRISKISLSQPAFDTGFLSPYNFGFGISYVLPIIVTGLIAEKQSVFLVENPEAHLHPKAQSHIGYFLTMMALSGIQIIVETHSEHVINGMRIAALKNAASPEDISINFFQICREEKIERNVLSTSEFKSAKADMGYKNVKHEVINVKLNERMDMETWPEGFLDQEEEDLRTLRELRRK